MEMGFCPECDADIAVGKKPFVGQKITCGNCGAYLRIISLSPIEIDWADDDDYDDYDEDMEDAEDDEDW